VAETDLERYAEVKQFPIIPCTLCGSQENLQRAQIKQMIRQWDKQYPGRIDNMFSAMGNIVPSHMMDRNLYPFTTLQTTGVADPTGDKAFDDDDDCGPAPTSVVQLKLDS
jgi:tRNA 2-thiocytidine biosynthesis protein TtcA